MQSLEREKKQQSNDHSKLRSNQNECTAKHSLSREIKSPALQGTSWSPRFSPPGTSIASRTQGIPAISSKLLRLVLRFKRPSTQSRASSQSFPFSASHSPSSSAYRYHDQSHRAIRWGVRAWSLTGSPRVPGRASNGSRFSIMAYRETPRAHASVERPS